MKFVVKFFPEITIKSRPVRQRLVTRLRDNISRIFRAEGIDANVSRHWDRLVIDLAPGADAVAARQWLARIPGISVILDVTRRELHDLDGLLEDAVALWAPTLAGKTFAVRCRRRGDHPFTSHEVEIEIGAGLLERTAAAGVDLRNPDMVAEIEIRKHEAFLVRERVAGLGGFPLGGVDPVLSLLSGGYDSTVASFQSMRRGMITHFCFFNLGGREHERGVKELAFHLWSRYGASQPVKFVSVPFEGVVAEILENVRPAEMGVVLKRQMMRAADAVAERANLDALVTGESVAQVSSQTLGNLSIIDKAIDRLVLRPLAMSNKEDIIKIARDIGADELCAQMPEYCGVISVKPTAHARMDRVESQEARLDPQVLQRALDAATVETITELTIAPQAAMPESMSAPVTGATVLDVRHPDEVERQPLLIPGVDVVPLPFYQLHSRQQELDKSHSYMLYCDRGVMSRMHAAQMLSDGFESVRVYRPR